MDSSSVYYDNSKLLAFALTRVAWTAQNELRHYAKTSNARPGSDGVDLFISHAHGFMVHFAGQLRLKKAPQRLDTLANQVLVCIAFCLPLADRINLVYTCRRIRSVLCSKPHLWTSVIGDSSPANRWLTRWILRCADPLPARLQMEMWTSKIIDDSDLQRLIGTHFERLSMLNLKLREIRLSREAPGVASVSAAWSLARKVLCAPAPHMSSLTLSLIRAHSSKDPLSPYLPTRLLASNSQTNLRRLETYGLHLYPNGRYPALTQLTAFHYAIPKAILHEWELEFISRNMPRLRYLGLHAYEYAPTPPAIATTEPPIQFHTEQVKLVYFSDGIAQLLVHFREVQALELCVFGSKLYADALDTIGAPHIQLFVFPNLDSRLYRIAARPSPQNASSTFSSQEGHCVDSHESEGGTPQQTALLHGYIPDSLAYQRITHIWTTENMWVSQFVRDFRGLNLPNLTELVITLAACPEACQTTGYLWLWPDSTNDAKTSATMTVPSLKRLYIINGQFGLEHEAATCVDDVPASGGSYGFELETSFRHRQRYCEQVFYPQHHRWRHGCPLWSAHSVSLFDVARFVGDLIAPTQRLDLVCLDGVTDIGDLGLEEAWQAVLKVAHKLEFGSPEHAKRAKLCGRKDLMPDGFPGREELMSNCNLAELQRENGVISFD